MHVLDACLNALTDNRVPIDATRNTFIFYSCRLLPVVIMALPTPEPLKAPISNSL